MPEAPTGETQAQSGPTAARQMLAALTRHSQEITKRFGESCEYVNRLNATLENKVNNKLSDINKTAEQIVRSQLENLSAEKDSVLAELTELRREELKVLQSVGKDLREALSQRFDELVAELKKEIDEKLSAYQENIAQTKGEVENTLVNLRGGLFDKMPEHLVTIQDEGKSVKKELEETQANHKELLSAEVHESLTSLTQRRDELKSKLDQSGDDYLKSLESLVENLLNSQREKLQQRIQAIAGTKDDAQALLQIEIENAEAMLSKFGDASQQIIDLRLGLHSSMTNSITRLYRTELVSLAQETEDQLVIVRSHLHSILRGYHDQYLQQANQLLAQFEENAKQSLPEKRSSEAEDESNEVPEQVAEFFVRFKDELGQKIKDLIETADKKLDESANDFRNRLNEANKEFCSNAETAFNDYRKEISDASEEDKAAFEDLAQKTDALEQLIDESKELISALDVSNLEF